MIKLAENAGYGFDKMFNGWLAHYPKAPIVEGGVDYYRIIFPLALKKAKKKRIQDKKVVSKGGQKKVTEKVTERVTENQKKILAQITLNPFVTTQELSKIVGISSRRIKGNIAKLKNKNMLKRVGPARGGYWKVKD